MTKKIKLGGVILEGPDQAGKSTLAEKLSKLMDVDVVHTSKPKNDNIDQYEYYTAPLKDLEPLIIDRSYLSEVVYGNVARGESRITDTVRRKIESIYRRSKYFMVICLRENYEWEDREEMFDADMNVKVIAKYKELFESPGYKFNMPVIRVDPFDESSVQRIVDMWVSINKLDAPKMVSDIPVYFTPDQRLFYNKGVRTSKDDYIINVAKIMKDKFGSEVCFMNEVQMFMLNYEMKKQFDKIVKSVENRYDRVVIINPNLSIAYVNYTARYITSNYRNVNFRMRMLDLDEVFPVNAKTLDPNVQIVWSVDGLSCSADC